MVRSGPKITAADAVRTGAKGFYTRGTVYRRIYNTCPLYPPHKAQTHGKTASQGTGAHSNRPQQARRARKHSRRATDHSRKADRPNTARQPAEAQERQTSASHQSGIIKTRMHTRFKPREREGDRRAGRE